MLGVAATAVLLAATACSSAGDSGSTAAPSSTAAGSSTAGGSGSPSVLPTDASVDSIAERFRCQVTESTSQSSESVAASNSDNTSGGGLGVPVTQSSVICHRQAFDYAIASFENTEGKQKVTDFLKGLVKASTSQYAYCDGGLWVVNVDVDIQDQPTPEQVQKLQRGAQVAHEQLGCEVVTIDGTSASSSGGATASASPPTAPSS